jgi:hypothetical protein
MGNMKVLPPCFYMHETCSITEMLEYGLKANYDEEYEIGRQNETGDRV